MRVSDYLIKCLEKIGINHVFGLPGDYNFEILYSVNRTPNVEWVGCTNELNAGYAADGYAREKGFGAIVTTYGVGELSAINAIAGSYAENVPVISIVGVPQTRKIENKTLIHHNFLTPNYYAFEQAYKNVTETTAYLTKENAKSEIDRILTVFLKERKPVYVAIPIDVTQAEIDDKPGFEYPKSDEETLKTVVDKIKTMVENSKHPVLLADNMLKRYQCVEGFRKLAQKTNYPTSNFLMGMGAINTSSKNYAGTYLASYGNETAKEVLYNTDCLISFGVVYSDLNAFGFSLPYDYKDYVAIYGSYTIINHKQYDNVMMKDVIEALTEVLPKRDCSVEALIGYHHSELKNEKLTSDYIYPRLQEFFSENDSIFLETGIIQHGFAGTRLPDNVTVNAQTLWGSIGWATPAAFGGAVALENTDKRVVLLTGEGSHQLTATEVSNMMHRGLKPVVIVLNNHGYTIERLLSAHPDDSFNNIIQWDYSKLPAVFEGEVEVAQARTDKEFDIALKNAKNNNKMNYIEIFTEEMDIPVISKKTLCKIKKQ